MSPGLIFALLAGPLSAAPAAAGTFDDVCKAPQTFTDRVGTMAYPGGDVREYKNNLDVCWTIAPKLQEGERLVLMVKSIDVEKGHDFLSVYGRSSGGLIDADAESRSIYFDGVGFGLRFTSDGSVTKAGFTLSWEVRAVEPQKGTDEVDVKVVVVENEAQAVPPSARQALMPRRGAAWLRSCGFVIDPTLGFDDEDDARAELDYMEQKCGSGE